MQPYLPQGTPLDPKALFEAHGAFIKTLARAMVADEHTAEDLAHDTWAAVVSRPPAEVRDARAWLSTILQRRVASYRRKLRKSAQPDPVDAESLQVAADDADQQLEYEHVLHTAVRSLDEPYRSTIFLRYHEGLPPRTIADRTGVPVKTVKTRLSRALAKLRTTLDIEFKNEDDAGTNWRHALVPMGVTGAATSKLASSGAAVHLGAATTPLLFGMKKFIVVVAVLLLGSAAWLFQRSGSSGGPLSIEPEAPAQVALAGVKPNLDVEEVPGPTAPLEREKTRQSAGPTPVKPAPQVEKSAVVVHVHDANDAPIEGRAIVLRTWPWATSGEPRIVRRTDARGRAAFAGLGSSHYLVADGAGSKEEDVSPEPGETMNLRWTVRDDVFVRGRVLDHRGAPVAGAEVWCSASSDRDGFMCLAARTDAGGRFMVRCSASATLQAVAPALKPSMARLVQRLAEVEPGVREVTLNLGTQGMTLSGRVIDATGNPIETASIMVLTDDWPAYSGIPGSPPRPTTVLTGPDGRFQCTYGLPMGEHSVVVRAKGFATKLTGVLLQDRPVELEVTLHGGIDVSGTVTHSDGSPAIEANVWVAQPNSRWRAYGNGLGPLVQADKDGRFTLRGVPPGPTSIRAKAGWTEGTLAQGAETIEVFEQPVTGVHLVLQVGRSISGRIVDLEGSPIAGRVVTAFCYGVKSNDARTGPDGTYTIGSLPEPDGSMDEWEVIVRTWTGTNTRLLGERHRVAPNSQDVDFVIERFGEASATIVGRVVGSEAQVAGDIEVILGDQDSRGGSSLAIDPDTGSFSKGPLMPGTYRIKILRAGVPVIAESDLVARPGETIDAGVIRLDDGGSIEVRPTLTAALPFEAQRLESMFQQAAASMIGPGNSEVVLEWVDGAWRHAGTLEAGTWHVEILAEELFVSKLEVSLEAGGAMRAEASVALGRQVDVRVDLPAEADAWSTVKTRMSDGAGRVFYDGPAVSRADLQDPRRTNVKWTVPLGIVRIEVTTNTEVSAAKTLEINPGDEPTLTVPLVAQ